jgi:hypothetical protein
VSGHYMQRSFCIRCQGQELLLSKALSCPSRWLPTWTRACRQNSYRVRLDTDGHLVWITEINGREVQYHKKPETSFGQRFMSGFIQLLPVEHQL